MRFDKLGGMFIGEQDWETLRSYLSADFRQGQGVEQAPKVVFALVSSLVSADEIVTGHSDYVPAQSTTTWRTWILTHTSIAYVEVLFDAELYTSEAESLQGQYREKPPELKVVAAWVRPMSDVSGLEIEAVSQVLLDGWFVSLPRLRFRGHTELFDLPSQQGLHGDQRVRSDAFYRELRDRIFN